MIVQSGNLDTVHIALFWIVPWPPILHASFEDKKQCGRAVGVSWVFARCVGFMLASEINLNSIQKLVDLLVVLFFCSCIFMLYFRQKHILKNFSLYLSLYTTLPLPKAMLYLLYTHCIALTLDMFWHSSMLKWKNFETPQAISPPPL